MSRGYSPDLAYIHNAGFSGYIREAAPHLLRLLRNRKRRKHLPRKKPLVIDLGCGSGVWARELARAGYSVIGIDISESMLRLARRNAPSARFIKGSFCDVKLPQCHAVTAFGEVINYQFDPHANANQLSRLFARVYAALCPGGVFLFDVAGPGRAGSTGMREGNSFGRDWAILFRVEEDKKHRRLTRTITSFRRAGKLYRRSQEIHEQRLYTAAEITSHLRGAGFQVKRMAGYGGSPFPEGLAGFVATKV